ncbi:MAG: gliding motility-associated C-terminal domain-containing protein, partial [Saprospiraceae bacterium]|nr:gliding motility-associated C-terminal domain-containing protein [Saprospiraceae bacterium]
CEYKDSVVVTPNMLVAPVIENNYVLCINQAEIQFNETSGNQGISWSWTFSGGTPGTSNVQNPVITFTEEGQITAQVIISDAAGCVDTTEALVDVVFIDDEIPAEIEYCRDSNTVVYLNPNGIDGTANYLWTSIPADPNLVSTDSNPGVNPTQTTVYSVVISQGTQCSVVYSVTVTPLSGPNLSLQDSLSVCSDTPVTVTASGTGTNYVWSNSPTFNPVLSVTTTLTVNPIVNGTYYVRASDGSQCVALDSIWINNGTVHIEAEPAVRKICEGEDTELVVTNLDAEDQLTYVWSPNLPNTPNQVVTPSTETTYHVTVTNQFGCTDDTNFLVSVVTVGVDAEVTGPDTICPGQLTTLLATPSGNGSFFSFDWSPADGLNDPTIQNPTASPTQDQVYTVTVTTDNECTATDEVIVYFISSECLEPYIFVPKAFTPNNDSNNDFFIVRGVNIKELEFVVWDRWGEKVYYTNDPNAQGWDGTFKGKELTPDSYAWYLRATCGNGAVYEKKGDVTLLK